MLLRAYQSNDLTTILTLFYQTVHTINTQDYNQLQVDTWAPKQPDYDRWHQLLKNSYCLVAIDNNQIVGFGTLENNNYLNLLYVHKDYQKQGIATLICDALEQQAQGNDLTVHASITAKPFFEQRGYDVIKQQQVEKQDVIFINYLMQKSV